MMCVALWIQSGVHKPDPQYELIRSYVRRCKPNFSIGIATAETNT